MVQVEITFQRQAGMSSGYNQSCLENDYRSYRCFPFLAFPHWFWAHLGQLQTEIWCSTWKGSFCIEWPVCSRYYYGQRKRTGHTAVWKVCLHNYKNRLRESRKWKICNSPPKGRWIVVDIYRDAKRRGTYPPLFTDPEGDSCFSIYQIRWIKKCRLIHDHNFFFWNFRETTRHFSLRAQNSEYRRIFQVTGANQNARKLLSTDLVNTN